MQTGAVGLHWAQLAGSLVAYALVVGTFFSLLWLKRRRREKRRERPPQREKLLRPAGYSAMCRVDGLAEKRMWAMFQAIGAGMVFGLTAGTLFPLFAGVALARFTVAQIWAVPKADVLIVVALVGLIALLWTIRGFQTLWKIDDELRSRSILPPAEGIAAHSQERGQGRSRPLQLPPQLDQRRTDLVTARRASALEHAPDFPGEIREWQPAVIPHDEVRRHALANRQFELVQMPRCHMRGLLAAPRPGTY